MKRSSNGTPQPDNTVNLPTLQSLRRIARQARSEMVFLMAPRNQTILSKPKSGKVRSDKLDRPDEKLKKADEPDEKLTQSD